MIPIAYSDRFVLELPEGHRFPMIKYELIKEQLVYEGTASENNFTDPGLLPHEVALLTHSRDYHQRLLNLNLTPKEMRKIGFPLSQRLIDRSHSSAMGTLYAAEQALKTGIGMNTAGGTHHAYSNRGEGFCLMNDIAIAANYLLDRKLAKQILVIDLDVHQGNGTAEIFFNNKRVFTFSMHCSENYPLHKEKSDMDISLKHGTNDHMYLDILKNTLPVLINKVKPDFLFFQAGVDILETDKLGKLAVSTNGCKERDEFVLTTAKQYDIPIVVVMGGGYSPRVSDIVHAHCNTFRTAFGVFS